MEDEKEKEYEYIVWSVKMYDLLMKAKNSEFFVPKIMNICPDKTNSFRTNFLCSLCNHPTADILIHPFRDAGDMIKFGHICRHCWHTIFAESILVWSLENAPEGQGRMLVRQEKVDIDFAERVFGMKMDRYTILLIPIDEFEILFGTAHNNSTLH